MLSRLYVPARDATLLLSSDDAASVEVLARNGAGATSVRQRIQRPSFILFCALVPALLTSSSPGQCPSAEESKVDLGLAREPTDGGSGVAVWVFFTDKGIRAEAAYQAAIERVAGSYNERAIARRRQRRTASGMFDERDLPVVRAYIDAVTATGARCRNVARWLNAVSVYATDEQIRAIAELPFVRRIQPVRRVTTISLTPSATWTGRAGPDNESFYGHSESQLSQIGLPPLHEAGFTGKGVVIGVLDTGFRKTHEVFNHPEHPLRVVAEWDFVNDDPNTGIEPGDTSEQHEHGTYILAILAAYKPGELVGAAYDASYILCKVEEVPDEYKGEEDFFVAGLEFIEAHGGDVATSSVVIYVGYTPDQLDGSTSPMTKAVNAATANGLHVCQGAGNMGHDTDPSTNHLIPPADAFDAMTCGAVQSDGSIATTSSDGPTADGRVKPEVLTRGVDVWTVSADADSGYTTVSGTSTATPQLCGAVACLLQARPDWDVEQMRSALFTTADGYAANRSFDPAYVRGYGVINAARALHASRATTSPDWRSIALAVLLLAIGLVVLRRLRAARA
jgi:subtilisin family serine protease